ncbi:MAG: protein rep [Bacteroidota bacterium]
MSFDPNEQRGRDDQKNTYLTVNYRHRNLKLADKLDSLNCNYSTHPEINKVVRNLRWCSSVALVEHDYQSASLFESSKNCKNTHCAICARNRSTKLVNRLLAAIKDKDNADRFDDKYFYFLTLTVKHDDKTRTGNYLDEFNKYFNSLVRSKMWKRLFPTAKGQHISGWIHNRECTLCPHGYHIHAHTLICCPRLTKKIKLVQEELRLKWWKITGDSEFGVRFDLIKFDKSKYVSSANSGPSAQSSKVEFGAIREVFKYSVKAGQIDKIGDGTTEGTQKLNLYAEWILSTKGKNFINCSGLFRGLELTGAKSRYDKEVEKREVVDAHGVEYAIGKTSNISFNYAANRDYSKGFRKHLMKMIYVKKLGGSFQDVTEIVQGLRQYLMISKTEGDIMKSLDRWIEFEKKAKAEIDLYSSFAVEQPSDEQVKAMLRQLELFDFSQKERTFSAAEFMEV